jgi:hypothetical protein
MADDPQNPQQPPASPKTPRRRSQQDQETANLITESAELIGTIRADAEIAAIMGERGYSVERLDEGSALQAAAQSAFNTRQTALAEQKQATANLQAKETEARRTYQDFRETARAIFTTDAERVYLGLKGEVKKDLEKFITQARASYDGAKAAPYITKLASYGFPLTSITAAIAGLDQLEAANTAQNQAIGAAKGGTSSRIKAVEGLAAWVSQLRKIAKVALRSRPDLLAKLKL